MYWLYIRVACTEAWRCSSIELYKKAARLNEQYFARKRRKGRHLRVRTSMIFYVHSFTFDWILDRASSVVDAPLENATSSRMLSQRNGQTLRDLLYFLQNDQRNNVNASTHAKTRGVHRIHHRENAGFSRRLEPTLRRQSRNPRSPA